MTIDGVINFGSEKLFLEFGGRKSRWNTRLATDGRTQQLVRIRKRIRKEYYHVLYDVVWLLRILP